MAEVDPEWADSDRVGEHAQRASSGRCSPAYLAARVPRPRALREGAARLPAVAEAGRARQRHLGPDAASATNVDLVTDAIAEITEKGIRTADGVEHEVDVIIYGTGFQASKFLTPMRVTGASGVDLHERWGGDARAYLGITVPGFPNLFLLYGPNTNIVINGSIIYFSECEVRLHRSTSLRHAARERPPQPWSASPTCTTPTTSASTPATGRMAWGASDGQQLVQERQRPRRPELALRAARVLAADQGRRQTPTTSLR